MKRIMILTLTVIMILAAMSTASFAIVWPTVNTYITQHFSPSHEAIDIAPSVSGVAGDPVYAFSYGTIYNYAWNNLAGWSAHINHPTSSTGVYIYTRSSHMSNPNTISGATTYGYVATGGKIGEMDTTGSETTGVHLHFVMRQNTQEYNINSGWYAGYAVDPEAYFIANGILPNYLTYIQNVDPHLATEKNLFKAIKVYYNGRDYDVRWLADMSDEDYKYYSITRDILIEAYNLTADNVNYTETHKILEDKLFH